MYKYITKKSFDNGIKIKWKIINKTCQDIATAKLSKRIERAKTNFG